MGSGNNRENSVVCGQLERCMICQRDSHFRISHRHFLVVRMCIQPTPLLCYDSFWLYSYRGDRTGGTSHIQNFLGKYTGPQWHVRCCKDKIQTEVQLQGGAYLYSAHVSWQYM